MIINELLCKCHGEPVKKESYGDEYFYFCQTSKAEIGTEEMTENLNPSAPSSDELLAYLADPMTYKQEQYMELVADQAMKYGEARA